MNENVKEKKKHKGLKVFLIILACIIGLVLIAGGALYFYVRHLYSGFTDPNAPEIVEQEITTETDLEVPEEDFSPKMPKITPDEKDKPGDNGEDTPSQADAWGYSYGEDYTGEFVPYVPEGGWPVETIPIYKKAQIDPNVVNILLAGIDVSNFEVDGSGRSDSMILLSFNKSTGSVKMFSFMRDSLVPIPGVGWTKLNHSYAYGKIGLTINTLNSLFGLDIQSYAVVDWSGLKEIVNYIGGIDVILSEEEAAYYNSLYNTTEYKSGPYHFNGYQAWRHSSNRKIGGDYERTRRQRDVLTAIYNKVMSKFDLGNISEFINFISGSIKTNVSFDTMTSFATMIFNMRGQINIEPYQVPLPGTYEGGWYNCVEGWLSVVRIDIPSNRAQILAKIYG